MQSTNKTPSAIHRILCSFLYTGFAPVAYLLRYHQKSDFTNHHIRHALASAFAMHVTLLTIIILRIPLIQLGIHREDIYFAIRVDTIQPIFIITAFGILVLLTGFSIVYALRGKSGKVFILNRISMQPWLPISMAVIFTVCLVLLLTIAYFAYYSLSITPQHNNDAKVFMLYDDRGFIPRWLCTLIFLPVTNKTIEVDGNSVCVCKLTPESLKEAFSKGKFVFLATHGAGPGMIYANGQIYKADDALRVSDGNHPFFIYLTGCSVSKDNNSWAEAFPRAEVISFDRWSAGLEHALWLYSEGPEKLASVFP